MLSQKYANEYKIHRELLAQHSLINIIKTRVFVYTNTELLLYCI